MYATAMSTFYIVKLLGSNLASFLQRCQQAKHHPPPLHRSRISLANKSKVEASPRHLNAHNYTYAIISHHRQSVVILRCWLKMCKDSFSSNVVIRFIILSNCNILQALMHISPIVPNIPHAIYSVLAGKG